jgi:hypothetical protein
VKALLLDSECPVDINDLAEELQISRGRMSSTLSGIESVCRVDPTRWWIRDRVDVPYSGIADEIERRIQENGGYYEVAELIRSIPDQFGVSPSSVETYMSAPAFQLDGKYLFLRDPASIHLRPLSDVIDGFDDNGFPYWSFEVNESHFRGYGISGVPPEFVVHLGCPIGGMVSVPLLNGTPVAIVTATWRLKVITGAYLGNFSLHLRELGARSGDLVRVTALKGGLTIHVAVDKPADCGC